MNGPENWQWKLSFVDPATDKYTTVPARVPGNVLGDLHRAGTIPDPYFGNNSDALRPYEFVDWSYETRFTPPEVPPDGSKLVLTFEGLDTFALIEVNGHTAGISDNMFIPHEFDITEFIVPDRENVLRVILSSPVNEARKFPKKALCCGVVTEALYIRKARHMYGWDIAPRLVGAGIWREVRMELRKTERWTDVYLGTVRLEENRAWMMLDWNFESDRRTLEGYSARLKFEHEESRIEINFPLRFTAGTESFPVENPHLWHPRGRGEPNLYHATLELLRDGQILDSREWNCGIRTIQLDRTEEIPFDGPGKFVFIVNGEKIFIKGSNWVPADALHGEEDGRIIKNLELFIELNCNMVRCWGGNVYESDVFFDFCDRNGLLVWQDFMFACENPPHDEEFQNRVRTEAEIIVKRLRNHASLALWCGDNEGDERSFYTDNVRRIPPSFNILTRKLLKEQVLLNDPLRDYLPSSPYLSDRIWKHSLRYLSPEQHLWGPRDSWTNSFYRDNTAIFASEIGYHGMPEPISVKTFLPEKSWNGRIGDPGWNCHSAQAFGDLNGPNSYRTKLMVDQVEGYFGFVPESLEDFSRCSQIVQAEAMKYFVESFRMKKWNKTGLIWWNVIDCWPQFSDAVVDYYYRRKLAFHYIRTSQRDLSMMLSGPKDWSLALTAVNDLPRAASGKYRVYDAFTGVAEAEGSYTLDANAPAKTLVHFRVCQGQRRLFLIEWEFEGKTFRNHFLLANPPIPFEDYRKYLEVLQKDVLDI